MSRFLGSLLLAFIMGAGVLGVRLLGGPWADCYVVIGVTLVANLVGFFEGATRK